MIYIYIFCFFELRLGAQLPFILIFWCAALGYKGARCVEAATDVYPIYSQVVVGIF